MAETAASGMVSPEREALEKQCEELGIRYQSNWSDDALRGRIRDKQGVKVADERTTLINQLDALGWPMEMVSDETSVDELKDSLKKLREMRKAKAEQNKKFALGEDYGKLVKCEVLPMGGGKISKGYHIGGLGEIYYDEGDEIQAEIQNARKLKERGFVKILEK